MYVYCICPNGKLKSNFIKIGLCKEFGSLKKRQKIIHKNFKNMNLHIENELFIYNEKYDFNFYVQQINELILNNSKKENKISIIFFTYIKQRIKRKIINIHIIIN